jgi:hypothetical protein
MKYPNTLRKILKLSLLSLAAFTITNVYGEDKTVKVTLNGGDEVTVRYIGQPIENSRIASLVTRADRSLVTTNPGNAANGTMQTGDRIAITNDLMLWFDCTRETGYYSGGGGMLRGVWRMVKDSSNNLNFKYILNTNGWAPNNFYPGQAAANNNGRGDAWQILCIKEFGRDPENTYRSTSSERTNVIDGGTYDSATSTLNYHFSGEMTTGKGTADSQWSSNIGASGRPAKLNYHATYKIYTNKQGANGYRVDAAFSVDVADANSLNNTDRIKSVVFSLGMGRTNIDPQLRLDWFKPIAQNMVRGAWSKNSNGVWVNFDKDITKKNENRNIPYVNKVLQDRYVIGSMMLNTNQVFDTKYFAGTNADVFQSSFRMRMQTNVSDSNVGIFDIGTYYQYVYDNSFTSPNFNFVQDIKIGDDNQAGIIGVMNKGSVIRCNNKMYFDYDVQ